MERAGFLLCFGLGRVLRGGTYATHRVVRRQGMVTLRKSRRTYAPAAIWLGGYIFRAMDAGVRVLPQKAWEERERLAYRILGRPPVAVEEDGTVILPFLPGETLAALLDQPPLEDSARFRMIELAIAALKEFHAAGLTHGDAMAENVLVDLETGVAHWIDFETVHDGSRSISWGRADDLRALLATCLLRTPSEAVPATLRFILDAYADEDVTRIVARLFSAAVRRPLPFHLGQAPLSLERSREIARLLDDRVSIGVRAG